MLDRALAKEKEIKNGSGRRSKSERFNGKIKNNVLKKYLFSSIFELKEKLLEFINHYNFNTSTLAI